MHVCIHFSARPSGILMSYVHMCVCIHVSRLTSPRMYSFIIITSTTATTSTTSTSTVIIADSTTSTTSSATAAAIRLQHYYASISTADSADSRTSPLAKSSVIGLCVVYQPGYSVGYVWVSCSRVVCRVCAFFGFPYARHRRMSK